MQKRITVIGDGGWGTALALVLHRNGHKVTMWGFDANYLESVRSSRENHKYLPGVSLPPGLTLTPDRRQAADAEIAVLASPSRFFRSVNASFQNILPPTAILISVAKGLEPETHQTMTDVVEELFPQNTVAALSGPSHAEEVARGTPAAVTIACRDESVADMLQRVFNNPNFRVYTSTDLSGVEIGGVLKNIVAIAAGVCDGIGFGDNTKAALITRGLAEIQRLGTLYEARPETFVGLSGIGDLIVTCTSRHSRNRSVGERIGKGEGIDDILASMDQVAEGYWNVGTVRTLAHKHGLEVPITEEVYQVLYQKKDPAQAVRDLLSREPKTE